MKNYSAIIIYCDYLEKEEEDEIDSEVEDIVMEARNFAISNNGNGLNTTTMQRILKYSIANGFDTIEPLRNLKRLINIYNE
ncbi:hypothetical protein [Lactococcus fujiensis]|nr:hypothetical protein [Lactococcus fujiensis]